VVLGVLVLAAVYCGVTAAQVWWASTRDERDPADAIVVLGAAQYDGEPSPVFAARLDHALALWEDGAATTIAVTGGGQPGDVSTESGAAADYLLVRGVPESALLREVDARTTYESLAATARLLRARDLDRVVLVSDPTHALRTELIAEQLGLDAQVSPTRTSPTSGMTQLRQGIRETVAVAVGRVVGHRRLPRIEELVGSVSA
jgi:uncharacterized SAM-binding protein YcdF (DUF218 family)